MLLPAHVGIHFRTAMWDGRKVEIGGIGGVSDAPGLPGPRLRTLALNAAILDDGAITRRYALRTPSASRTMKRSTQARARHPFQGEVYADYLWGRY